MTDLFKKVTDGFLGTKEQREEKKRQNQELNKIRQNAEFAGRKKGVEKAAFRRGLEEGKQKGRRNSGFIGAMGETIDGINRVEKAMGFDDMFNGAGYQGPPPPRQQRKKRRDESNPWGLP